MKIMEKNKQIIVDKKWYDVKIEVLLPATLFYKLQAEDAQQAAELTKNIKPNAVVYRLNGRKELKLTVYEMGCTIIKFMKNLMGVAR